MTDGLTRQILEDDKELFLAYGLEKPKNVNVKEALLASFMLMVVEKQKTQVPIQEDGINECNRLQFC